MHVVLRHLVMNKTLTKLTIYFQIHLKLMSNGVQFLLVANQNFYSILLLNGISYSNYSDMVPLWTIDMYQADFRHLRTSNLHHTDITVHIRVY